MIFVTVKEFDLCFVILSLQITVCHIQTLTSNNHYHTFHKEDDTVAHFFRGSTENRRSTPVRRNIDLDAVLRSIYTGSVVPIHTKTCCIHTFPIAQYQCANSRKSIGR